jgi:hypothetical protein
MPSANISITLDDYEILGNGPESRGSARVSVLLKCVGNATAIGDTGTFLVAGISSVTNVIGPFSWSWLAPTLTLTSLGTLGSGTTGAEVIGLQ